MQKTKQSLSKLKVSNLGALWLSLLILLVGLFTASYLDRQQVTEHQQHVQAALNLRLEQISHAVTEQVIRYQYGLRGFRGAILASGFGR